MFRSTHNKGFHIQLPTGICVSVQFGGGNYCEHYNADIGAERSEPVHQSYDAELMMWDTLQKSPCGRYNREVTQEWSQDAHGGVLGWVNAATVADAIRWASEYKRAPVEGLAPTLGGQPS